MNVYMYVYVTVTPFSVNHFFLLVVFYCYRYVLTL